MQIKEKRFRIIVKANSAKNEILGFDPEKNAYRVSIREPAEGNKANKEIIRFLTKTLKRKVFIKSGLAYKEKLIETE